MKVLPKEEPIFGDVGDYIFEARESEKPEKEIPKIEKAQATYFVKPSLSKITKGADEEEDNKPAPESEPKVLVEQLLANATQDMDLETQGGTEPEIETAASKKREAAEMVKRATVVGTNNRIVKMKKAEQPKDVYDEPYSECYPGAFETSLAYDSDEEDLTKMDTGSQKKKSTAAVGL